MNEHDYEPVPGLPARLPKGESIVWQGAPDWRTLARRAMHVRLIIGYFAVLAVWGIVGKASSHISLSEMAFSTLRLAGLGAVAVALLTLFAWLVARTTLYTITSRRVVMRFGIALPITIQIPFSKIDAAGARVWSDGAGDLSLTLLPKTKIAYLVLWPHARPWKLAKAQPTLRGLPDAAAVAQTLGRTLAASAMQPAKSITIPVADAAETGAHSGSHITAAA